MADTECRRLDIAGPIVATPWLHGHTYGKVGIVEERASTTANAIGVCAIPSVLPRTHPYDSSFI